MADAPTLETNVRRLALRPGDRLVVKVEGHLSEESCARMEAELRAFAGPDVPVLVLEAGCDLSVVGPAAEDGEA